MEKLDVVLAGLGLLSAQQLVGVGGELEAAANDHGRDSCLMSKHAFHHGSSSASHDPDLPHLLVDVKHFSQLRD
eukprot:2344950-Rhodomonas_salina.1